MPHLLTPLYAGTPQMKEMAAYMLLVLGGNAAPSAADVTGLLTTAGAEADAAQVAKIVAGMEGKAIDEVIAAGEAKMLTVAGSGGGGGGGGGDGAAEEAAPVEVEEEEEIDMGGGGGLFGGEEEDGY